MQAMREIIIAKDSRAVAEEIGNHPWTSMQERVSSVVDETHVTVQRGIAGPWTGKSHTTTRANSDWHCRSGCIGFKAMGERGF
jgi:hypothetical protein